MFEQAPEDSANMLNMFWVGFRVNLEWSPSKYTMTKWFSMPLNTSFIFHAWKNYGALTRPDSENGESLQLKPEEGGVIGSRCASAYPDCCCPVFGPLCQPLNYHRDLLPWSHLRKTLWNIAHKPAWSCDIAERAGGGGTGGRFADERGTAGCEWRCRTSSGTTWVR